MYILNTINIDQICVNIISSGKYKENTYIVKTNNSNDSIIIDPGLDYKLLTKFIIDNNLKPQAILLTHGHFDHITSVEKLAQDYNIEPYIHKFEANLIRQAGFYAYRFLRLRLTPPKNLTYFDSHLSLNWSGGSVNAIHTPGHTAGSVSYLINNNIIFTGDTLFKSYIGPHYYPESDYEKLVSSINLILQECSEDTYIFSGHGDPWNIKEARLWWKIYAKNPPIFQLFKN
jgi:hydroxyacylglutathione hydrolase